MRSVMGSRLLKAMAGLLLATFFSTFAVSPVHAETVNDVRELLGRQRIDVSDLQKELNKLAREYIVSDMNNIASQMHEIGKQIQIDPEFEVKRLELERKVQAKSEQVYEAFIQNKPIDDVLALKTELDNLMFQLNNMKKAGFSIEIEYVPNKWTEKYKEIQELVSKYTDDFDIGQVGAPMKFPVGGDFELTSPYGPRVDPFDETKIQFHHGIDLAAEQGVSALAQWNGIVVNVYTSPTYGNVVEIQHGKAIKTRYAHLLKPLVSMGDRVSQYQPIGLIGSTGRSTGPHLHFEVYVDGLIANPLMLYGKKGVNLLQSWADKHPNNLINTTEMTRVMDYTSDKNSSGYKYGFYNPLPPKEFPYTPKEIPKGAIVPKLPADYKRPEPGVLP